MFVSKSTVALTVLIALVIAAIQAVAIVIGMAI